MFTMPLFDAPIVALRHAMREVWDIPDDDDLQDSMPRLICSLLDKTLGQPTSHVPNDHVEGHGTSSMR